MIDIVFAVVAAVLALTLHEVSHGVVALMLGDDTARRAGRLTLNPIAHVDPIGTLLLPLVLVVTQLAALGRVVFMFGWAKPVPVDPRGFSNPRRMMAVVAAAGPITNFLLAWLAALSLHLLAFAPGFLAAPGVVFMGDFIVFNLVLGLFNLIPIPPLDGGRVMVGLLPARAAMAWARLERGGIAIVVLVVFLLPPLLRDVFGIAFDPAGWALRSALPAVLGLIGHLAGVRLS